jgi:ABC-type multidrug transport system permease subunit
MSGIINAIRLEFSSMFERKFSLILYLLAPILIIFLFYSSATQVITWGNYANLQIRLYDMYAPVILGLIVFFISLQLTILRIVGERAPYGTLDRDLMAISKTKMYLGKLIANSIYLLAQIAVIYLASFVLFPIKNYTSPFNVSVLLFLFGLFGIVTGLLISVISKNKESAIQLVPLFSGSMISLDSMPQIISSIAKNLPLTLTNDSLRNLMLDGVGFEEILSKVGILLIWIFSFLIIGILKFKFESKK